MSPEEMKEAIDLLCMMGLATLTIVSITFGLVVRTLWISATNSEDPAEYEVDMTKYRYSCCRGCGQSTAIDEDDICVRCAPSDQHTGKPVLDDLYVFETLEGIRNAGVGQQDYQPHVQLRMDLRHVLDILTVRLRKD